MSYHHHSHVLFKILTEAQLCEYMYKCRCSHKIYLHVLSKYLRKHDNIVLPMPPEVPILMKIASVLLA